MDDQTQQIPQQPAQSDIKTSGLTMPPTMSVNFPQEWTLQTTSDGVGYARFTENGKQYSVRFNIGGMGLPPNGNYSIDKKEYMLGDYNVTKSTISLDGDITLIAVSIGKPPNGNGSDTKQHPVLTSFEPKEM